MKETDKIPEERTEAERALLTREYTRGFNNGRQLSQREVSTASFNNGIDFCIAELLRQAGMLFSKGLDHEAQAVRQAGQDLVVLKHVNPVGKDPE